MRLFGMRKVCTLSAIFLFWGLVSCEKPEEQGVGLSVQPSGDQLSSNQTDTITVLTKTALQDSLRTDELSSVLLGNFNDPKFGETKAGVFTQLRLPTNGASFGNPTTLVIDSVVLAIEYNGSYGNLDAQDFKISLANESFEIDSNYYTNTPVVTNGTNMILSGYETITPKPEDTITIDGNVLPAQIRFRLDTVLAQNILSGNAALLENNDNFLASYPGIYIESTSSFTPDQGGLLYLDLISSNSKYTIYYTNKTDSSEHTFNLVIDAGAVRFSNFNHDYSVDIVNQLADSTLGQDKFYVQTTAGLNGLMYFPNIKDFANPDIAIAKAELVLPVSTDIGTYDPQETFLLYAVTPDGSLEFLLDQFEGSTHIDGTYDEVNSEYRFTITRFIQNLISENNYVALQVTSSAASVTGNRVIINGGGHATKKAKLVLTYINI
jgi:hypothetical protein